MSNKAALVLIFLALITGGAGGAAGVFMYYQDNAPERVVDGPTVVLSYDNRK